MMINHSMSVRLKTNIGHLEAAAGVAGLIKTVLAIHKNAIPAHLHLSQPSTRIDWQAAPIRVPTCLTRWPSTRRVAGVSSFGFSGTNAHVILEAYQAPVDEALGDEAGQDQDKEPSAAEALVGTELLCLSARSESALREMAGRYAAQLGESTDAKNAGDVCFTANTTRARFTSRLAVVGADGQSLSVSLQRFAETGQSAAVVSGSVQMGEGATVALLFSGQGSQWSGMGRELYARQPIFREALSQCASLLETELEQPLLPVMFGDSGV